MVQWRSGTCSDSDSNPPAFGSAGAANPIISPAALYAADANITAQGNGAFTVSAVVYNNIMVPTFTDAHTYTLDLTKNIGTMVDVHVWAPLPPGSMFSMVEGDIETVHAEVSAENLLQMGTGINKAWVAVHNLFRQGNQ